MWWVGVALAQDLSATASGAWAMAAPRAEVDAALTRSVDEAVANVSLLFRPFARPNLAPQAYACDGYTITLVGDQFTVQCDQRPSFSWRVGQTGPYTRNNGEVVQVSMTRDGRSLALDFKAEHGGKRFVYAFPEGGGLVVTQEVYSPYLSAPMRWTVAYKRRSP